MEALSSRVARFEQNEANVDRWAKGGPTDSIDFGGGPVRSPARLIADNQALFDKAAATETYITPTGGDDAAMIQQAVDAGRPIRVQPGATYLMGSTVVKEGGIFALIGKATFKLMDGVILNSDADSTNFTPLFRLQGMQWVDLGECTFDHNRDAQTYPASLSKVGRGSNPYRHNATVEICPDATGSYPSTNVHVSNAAFINSYLNGLALWQVTNAVVSDSWMINATWSGIVGAGLRNVKFVRTHGYRCGVSAAWTTQRNIGDRASIQIREFPKNFTTESEGIPCITTGEFANGGINIDVGFTGNTGEECGVETIFGRAIRGLSGSGNTSLNCGYGRQLGAPFYPAHFWFEFCQGSFTGNEVSQTVVQPGDMQPDGYVIYPMIGDASALFPFVGEFSIDARANRALSAKDDAGNSRRGLLYRGIRSTGNVNTDGAHIDGVDGDGIYVTNTDVFQEKVLNASNFTSNDSTVINTNLVSGGGPIRFVRYGDSTTGTPSNIFALNCRVDAEKAVIVFDANLSAFGMSNVAFSSGPGSVTSDADQLNFSVDAALWRRVINTRISANNVAGFQAQSNGGNTMSMGATSSTYSGSYGVAASAFIHASGANTGGLFITASGGPVVLRPGGARATTFFPSGRVRIGPTTLDDGNKLQVDGTIGLKSYAVAELPGEPGGVPFAFASDGCKVGEASGAGTGVAVIYSRGRWRTLSTDEEVRV
ncbi:hypothetical protein [Paraburkholderia antibiotica]|uniref:Uncharacterized protein n=1 Tax=Paraburkholderia antibiotica TaxID=2728839 RepID=A0A7X9X5F6_9BURK|nr:hypothetical protein [Paraburkholderia antibiotica]NML31781.1 hypothetical protein [Paraburkholderia antibiotica]